MNKTRLALEISIALNVYLAVWACIFRSAYKETVQRWKRDTGDVKE